MNNSYAISLIFPIVIGLAACDPGDGQTAPTESDAGDPIDRYGDNFTRYTVSDTIIGPSFATVADVNGDGTDEIVASNFGKYQAGQPMPSGQVTIYEFDGTLDSWTATEVVSTADSIPFPNIPTVADVDGDGDQDILLASGFFLCMPCGGLTWFEQDNDAWIRHNIVEPGAGRFFHHAQLADVDGDGRNDLWTVGEQFYTEEMPMIFLGDDSETKFENTAHDLEMGLGSSPDLYDIDGDGDLDMGSAEFFLPPAYQPFSYAWMEQTATPNAENPAGSWKRHVIADDIGPAIMLAFVENLYGDGKTYAVGSSHTNESLDGIESAVYVFDIPVGSETEKWPHTKISTGIKSATPEVGDYSPGVFGFGDVDGDGDIDIAVSGDGDPRVLVLVQNGPGVFDTRVLAYDLGQAGMMKVTDLDRDGRAEIVVSSYEEDLLYIYEWNN